MRYELMLRHQIRRSVVGSYPTTDLLAGFGPGSCETVRRNT
jgi:hypothetical protein